LGKYVLRCMKCSAEYGENSKELVCSRCGEALDTIYDYEVAKETFTKTNLKDRSPGVWKYIELLPIGSTRNVVSIGEGGTNLVEAKRLGGLLGFKNFYLKDESRNPTCSFKDRKSTVAITKASDFGFDTVAAATAGNAGSSTAAYAAKAGLRAIIFTFRNISRPKLSKLISYGASVFIVDGMSWETHHLLLDACKKYGWYNAISASRYNPYVKEGAKTEAIEICEQLDWNIPDWIILPVGGGCGLTSCWKGLRELRQMGAINTLPKLVGVQGAECAPLVKAYEGNVPEDKIERISDAHTVAHSIEDDFPVDGEQALRAVRESRGLAIGVEDQDILSAQKLIASREGLYVEPSSSAPVAAAKLLLDRGVIDSQDRVVCIATGFGLNEPEAIFTSTHEAPVVKPSIEALAAVFAKFS